MILSGLLSALPPFFEVCVVSSNPAMTQDLHRVSAVLPPPAGFRSFFRRGSFAIFSRIKKADFVLFGGGGLLQNREKKAIFLWAFYAAIVRFFRKKMLFVGNSIGPLQGFFAKNLAKNALSAAKFFSARDDFSLEFLKKIQREKIGISATDCVFLLPKFPRKKKRKGTLLSFRGDGNISPQKIQALFPFLPEPIVAFAHDRVDEDFAKKLGIPIMTPQNIEEVQFLFSERELVLTSRLHGGIFALCAETPFLCFSAAPKIRHFFEERGLQEVIFPENFSRKKITECLSKIKKEEKYSAKLRKIRISESKKAKNILPIFLQKD